MRKFALISIIVLALCSYITISVQAVEPPSPLATITAASESQLASLPIPTTTPRLPKTLTLQEAILLALRNNPDVQSSQLQRIIDKYALEIAYYAYEPQFSITGSTLLARGQKPSSQVNGNVTLNSTFGTAINVTPGFTQAGIGTGPIDTQDISVTQPLLNGFGAVNLIPLENAKDQEESNKLSFKNAVISIVVQIINDYYTVVEDYNNLRVQLATLKSQQQIVEQYRLQVKIGKLARSDLLQQEATLATTRLSAMEQTSTLEQDYQTLLGDIGLSPTLKFDVDYKINIEAYPLPSNDQAVVMALAGNIPYQQALLAINATKRAIKLAENDQKWTLNATGDINLTHFRPDTGSPSLQLDLTIPIAAVNLKQELIDAKVALEQAKLNLQNQKRQLIRTTLNDLTQLHYQLINITLDQNAVKLLEESLKAEEIKLKYGKSTVFAVTNYQNQLLSQQISLIDTQITYLLNIATFAQNLGQTLDQWNIKLEYYATDAKHYHNRFRY